jgi:Uma2 family endonuclease
MLVLDEVREAWTLADLAELGVEDWRRFQIVDGSLVVSPSPAGIHELFSEDLRAMIREALPPGLAVVGPMGVAIGGSYLIPDLVVVRRDRVRSADYLRPADVMLVVEVVSPSSATMDRLVKPAKYAAAGIPAFWRVETDPVGLTVYRLPMGAGAYAEIGTWGAGEVAEIAEPFPVRIDLAALVDR